MIDNEFKATIFDLVRRRLLRQQESLQLFCKHWSGTSGGIEAWLKVEFVAAIPPEVARISTGKRKDGICPDLLLLPPHGVEIPVELKALTDRFWYQSTNKCATYRNHLFASLSVSDANIQLKHQEQLTVMDKSAQLAKITDFVTPKGTRAYYFVLADLC